MTLEETVNHIDNIYEILEPEKLRKLEEGLPKFHNYIDGPEHTAKKRKIRQGVNDMREVFTAKLYEALGGEQHSEKIVDNHEHMHHALSEAMLAYMTNDSNMAKALSDLLKERHGSNKSTLYNETLQKFGELYGREAMNIVHTISERAKTDRQKASYWVDQMSSLAPQLAEGKIEQAKTKKINEYLSGVDEIEAAAYALKHIGDTHNIKDPVHALLNVDKTDAAQLLHQHKKLSAGEDVRVKDYSSHGIYHTTSQGE